MLVYNLINNRQFETADVHAHSQELDGKYSERVQLPAKAKFGGFRRQHLATLATPTIRLLL